MNCVFNLARPLLLGFFTPQGLLVGATIHAADSPALSIKVSRVVGSARYYTDDKNHPGWSVLRAGDELGGNPVLQTSSRDSIVDFELTGPDALRRVAVRMFSNTVLRQIRLSSRTSGSVKTSDILLDVAAGQIRISLDGESEQSFTLAMGDTQTRVTVLHSSGDAKDTMFVFNGTLTVLNGEVKASVGTGQEKAIHAGEQLRRGANEVTKTSPEAPELKLGQ